MPPSKSLGVGAADVTTWVGGEEGRRRPFLNSRSRRRGMRVCAEAGCPVLTKETRCEQHQRPQSSKGWTEDHDRVRGTTLQKLRRELFAREPLCRQCRKNGRTRAATIRDHITPLAEGGTDDDANIQPLCRWCSDDKTREESKRGSARRGRGGVISKKQSF